MGFETAELYHNRGWACHEWQYYEKQCSYEQAIADYDKAIELEPNTPDYYRDRAWSYRHLGEADLAITDYSKTIAINPKDVHAWHGRGLSQMDKAEYTEAIDDISQAISLTPDGFVLYWDRGNAYRYLGQIEDARADYETFLELTKGQSYPDWASQRNETKKWLDDTSETIQIRLRIVSSSDWTTVHLVSSNVIIFQRTVEQEGTLDIVDLNGPILHMNQTLARAEQGQTFELTQDITLHKQPDQKELKLIIEVGCIGETTVEPFLIGRYTLVSLGQITTNNCNLPGETYSVDLDAS